MRGLGVGLYAEEWTWLLGCTTYATRSQEFYKWSASLLDTSPAITGRPAGSRQQVGSIEACIAYSPKRNPRTERRHKPGTLIDS